MQELGFEGVDKAVDKYHDKAFDKFGKRRRHDRGQQQQESRRPPVSQSSRARNDTPSDNDDSQPDRDMYASDCRQDRDYQDRDYYDRRGDDRGESRYVSDETIYYRGPDAGAVAMRGSDPYNNARGYEVQVSAFSCPYRAALTTGSNINSRSTVAAAHNPRDGARRGHRNGLVKTVATTAVRAQGLIQGLAPGTGNTESQPLSQAV